MESWRKELYLSHHGIKGQKWGERNYQYEDGSLTPEGKKRYGIKDRIKSSFKAGVNKRQSEAGSVGGIIGRNIGRVALIVGPISAVKAILNERGNQNLAAVAGVIQKGAAAYAQLDTAMSVTAAIRKGQGKGKWK